MFGVAFFRLVLALRALFWSALLDDAGLAWGLGWWRRQY